jgi:hypothetical protein
MSATRWDRSAIEYGVASTWSAPTDEFGEEFAAWHGVDARRRFVQHENAGLVNQGGQRASRSPAGALGEPRTERPESRQRLKPVTPRSEVAHAMIRAKNPDVLSIYRSP